MNEQPSNTTTMNLLRRQEIKAADRCIEALDALASPAHNATSSETRGDYNTRGKKWRFKVSPIIMETSTMLYSKFKNTFLAGEGDSVITGVLNKSLAKQRQHEEGNKTKDPGKKRSREQSLEKEQTGSKILHGGSDARDRNQPQHNGDSNEEGKAAAAVRKSHPVQRETGISPQDSTLDKEVDTPGT